MGQSLSTNTKPRGKTGTEKIRESLGPPIENLDQFIDRFRLILKSNPRKSTSCLSEKEERWMEAVFKHFATPGPPVDHWTVSDLADFLSIFFPSEWHSTLKAAAPLLHCLILSLGHFPYHNRPGLHLRCEILKIGILMLLGRHQNVFHFSSLTESSALTESSGHGSLQHQLNLFLSMTERARKSMNYNPVRDDANDAHLLQAHTLVKKDNWAFHDRDACPKLIVAGPPLPPVTSFPSSCSQEINGKIPVVEFQALVSLLLSCLLFLSGIGPETVLPSVEHERLSKKVVRCFLPGDQHKYIVWEGFRHAMSMHTPHLFVGLMRILAPFLSGGHGETKLHSFPTEDPIPALRKAFASPFKSAVGQSGPIPLPLLLQLSTFLPLDLSLDHARLLYSCPGQSFSAMTISQLISQPEQPIILLVTGSADETSEQEAVFGVFFPDTSRFESARVLAQEEVELGSRTPLLFQLSPEHHVFPSRYTSLHHHVSPSRPPKKASGPSGFKLWFAADGVKPRLVLDDSSGTVLFNPGPVAGRTAGDEICVIRKVEVIGLLDEEESYVMETNYTFWVDSVGKNILPKNAERRSSVPDVATRRDGRSR